MSAPSQTATGAADTAAPEREAATALGQSFKACMSAVRRLRGRESHGHGELSDAQFGLLFGLRDQEEMATSELACLAGLSPATATQMLEGLASAGLVSRVRSQRDRRVVLTSLTEHGRELVTERHARFAGRWAAALTEFSDSELATAAAVLDRLRGVFEGLGAELSPGAQTGEPPQS